MHDSCVRRLRFFAIVNSVVAGGEGGAIETGHSGWARYMWLRRMFEPTSRTAEASSKETRSVVPTICVVPTCFCYTVESPIRTSQQSGFLARSEFGHPV